jgi:hypothetical protein
VNSGAAEGLAVPVSLELPSETANQRRTENTMSSFDFVETCILVFYT